MAELSEFVRSPKRAKTYLYICEGLSFLIGLVVILALIYLWQHFNWWHFLIYVFIGLIVISFIYMLTIPWTEANGWDAPKIVPCALYIYFHFPMNVDMFGHRRTFIT